MTDWNHPLEDIHGRNVYRRQTTLDVKKALGATFICVKESGGHLFVASSVLAFATTFIIFVLLAIQDALLDDSQLTLLPSLLLFFVFFIVQVGAAVLFKDISQAIFYKHSIRVSLPKASDVLGVYGVDTISKMLLTNVSFVSVVPVTAAAMSLLQGGLIGALNAIVGLICFGIIFARTSLVTTGAAVSGEFQFDDGWDAAKGNTKELFMFFAGFLLPAVRSVVLIDLLLMALVGFAELAGVPGYLTDCLILALALLGFYLLTSVHAIGAAVAYRELFQNIFGFRQRHLLRKHAHKRSGSELSVVYGWCPEETTQDI